MPSIKKPKAPKSLHSPFESELSCVQFTASSRGLKNKLLELRDVSKITHIVVHTTGVSIYKNRLDKPDIKPLGLAKGVAWTYQNIMDDSGHFVVAADGIGQTVPVKYSARHVGGQDHNLYAPILKEMWLPQWWHHETDKYPLLKESTRRAWKKGSCNAVSIGVELLPPRTIKGSFDAKTLENAKILLRELLEKYPQVEYVTTHARVCPTKRTSKNKPYDLFDHLWKQLETECRDLFHSQGARGPVLT